LCAKKGGREKGVGGLSISERKVGAEWRIKKIHINKNTYFESNSTKNFTKMKNKNGNSLEIHMFLLP
jgi:hypothetical protein